MVCRNGHLIANKYLIAASIFTCGRRPDRLIGVHQTIRVEANLQSFYDRNFFWKDTVRQFRYADCAYLYLVSWALLANLITDARASVLGQLALHSRYLHFRKGARDHINALIVYFNLSGIASLALQSTIISTQQITDCAKTANLGANLVAGATQWIQAHLVNLQLR